MLLRETIKEVKTTHARLDILLLVQVCNNCNFVKTQNRVHRFSSKFLIRSRHEFLSPFLDVNGTDFSLSCQVFWLNFAALRVSHYCNLSKKIGSFHWTLECSTFADWKQWKTLGVDWKKCYIWHNQTVPVSSRRNSWQSQRGAGQEEINLSLLQHPHKSSKSFQS